MTDSIALDLGREMIRARLREASGDDHFYGAWSGGSKAEGGHPAGGSAGGPSGLSLPAPKTTKAGIEDAASAWTGMHYTSLRGYQMTGQVPEGYRHSDDPIHGLTDQRAAQSVSTLSHAIATGPAAPELSRGMRPSEATYSKLAALKPGQTIDLPLTSFSSERQQAANFASSPFKASNRPVMVTLSGGAHAFNIEQYSHYPAEKEWISQGRFEVVRSSAWGNGLELTIRQVGVFEP